MKSILRTFKNLISIGCLRRTICNTNPTNLVIYFIIVVLFTTEVFLYYFATFTWQPIECYSKSECTKILLVADPQIIGLHNEQSELLTPLAIWDSDRYLAKTFAHAFHFTQPDVVIFLGDLFDEGSTSTDEEFHVYLRRLFNIFLKKPYQSVHHIWLPGDNDIGGEYNDRITPHKVKRFEHAFSQPDVISIKNIKFFKVNRLTSTIPKSSQLEDFSNVDNIRIALSHVPLLTMPNTFVDKTLDKLHPHLLFTAHNHKSMVASTQDEFRKDRLITPITPSDNHILDYYLGVTDIYEVLLPTCSYRMGTTQIGYGYAVIENGRVRYTVLWSPSRFPQLFFYAILIVFGISYLFCGRLIRCNKKNNMNQYERLNLTA